MIRFAAITAVAIVASASQAALIGPGGSVFMHAGQVGTVGTAVTGVLASPFANANFNGTLYSQVFTGTTGNTLGGLSFAYLLVNNATSANALERLTINGYAGFQTDVTFDASITPGSLAPVAADRSFGAGDVVGNFFGADAPGYSPLNPGTQSAVVIIHTDAPSWTTTIASVIDGLTAQVPTYAPAVPTPGAAGLLGLGFVASARRRRA
jgi:hypothetical protein